MPSAQGAFNVYETLSFGGKFSFQGDANVTTNATTNTTFNSTTFHGYLVDNGNLDTVGYFEYGLTQAYGKNTTSQSVSSKQAFNHTIDGETLTETFYFTDYSSNTWSNPAYLVDGDEDKYSYTVGTSTSLLNETNYSDIHYGEIEKVEFRYKTEYWGQHPEDCYVRGIPSFDGLQGETRVHNGDGWTEWYDITNDTNAPTKWYWDNVSTLELYLNGACVDDCIRVFSSMAELRVTHNNELLPGKTYHYRSVATNANGTIYGSDMAFRTWDPLATNETTVTSPTAATVNGYLYYDINENTNVGFWVGNVSVNSTNFERNFSVASTRNSNEAFTYPATGLNSSTYYYIRSWMNNSNGFFNTSNETYFITKPNSPSNLEITEVGASSFTLRWDNTTVPAGVNLSTVIVYNKTSIPTSVSGGTVGANVTGTNTTTITGLDIDTLYYISAFHYINDSGSPTLWQYSSTYSWVQNITGGGSYNMSIRYENTTYGRLPTNLYGTNWRAGYHSLIIHYLDTVEYNYFNSTGYLTYTETNWTYINNETGTFAFNTSKTPLWVEFNWNESSTNKSIRCRRKQIFESGERNITFYMTVDKLIYGESTAYFNQSIVPYTFLYEDKSGIFIGQPDLDTYVTIYTYDDNGTKLVIDQQFWDSYDQTYPWLVHCKSYWWSITCTDLEIDPGGILYLCGETSSEQQLVIMSADNMSYTIADVLNVRAGWMSTSTGMYIYYNDLQLGLTSINASFISFFNGTVHQYNTSTNYTKNFTYFGANQSMAYKYSLKVYHVLFDGFVYVNGTLYPPFLNISNATEIENWLELIFGDSPFEGNGHTIPWIYIVIFVIGFITLLTFSIRNSRGALAITGVWYMFAGIGAGVLPNVGDLLGSALLVVGGFFMFFLAIISGLGDKR